MRLTHPTRLGNSIYLEKIEKFIISIDLSSVYYQRKSKRICLMENKRVLMDSLDLQKYTAKLPHECERLTSDYFTLEAVEHIHRYVIARDMLNKHDSVLDIASGDGYGSNILAVCCKHIIGIDISEQTVLEAKQKYRKNNLDFRVGDIVNIPIDSNSIDVVVSFETLEHHDKHEEMLSEIKRVLKDNGKLIISTPDKKNYTEATGNINPFHIKELYYEEFIALLRKYFRHVECIQQQPVYGSMISPNSQPAGFMEYSGDYEKIESSDKASSPLYHICIASDADYSFPSANRITYFDGWGALRIRNDLIKAQHNKELDAYRNSYSYRLGRFLLSPFRPFIKLKKSITEALR